jgi:trimethylamine--corrinoid protein Co-methyltransferase
METIFMANVTPQLKPIIPKHRHKVLTDVQLEDIQAATFGILEETGFYCPSERALTIYAENGGQVDFENQIVRLPGPVVLGAMAHAPRYYTLGSRSPDHDLVLDGTATYVATDGTGVETVDFKTGQRRNSIKADVARMARVADYLPSIGFYWPMVSAQDHPETASLHELEASFNNTVKHVQTCTVVEEKTARYAIEMAKAICGDEATMQARPPFSSLICTIAPLSMDLESMEAALVFAEAHIPVGFMSMACGGLSSPATVAGTVAVADAEMVAAMVLIQLAYPGAPVYHSMMPSLMDRMTGDFDGGAWNADLFSPIAVELAHKWGVPTLAPVGTSASISGWSSAAGIKSGMLSVAMSGADTASGIGLRETCTLLTQEALVLDAEFCNMARVDASGLDTSQEAFSLDMIKRVGPRGNFLKEKKTRQQVRSLEYSELTTQTGPTGGNRDPIDVARDKTAWILKNHYPEPPDEKVQVELKHILAAAEGELT